MPILAATKTAIIAVFFFAHCMPDHLAIFLFSVVKFHES